MTRKIAVLVVVCTALAALAVPGEVRLFAQSSVPSPWVSVDVGAPPVAGSASFNQGSFTVSGSGADIDGTADQFQFVYQQISGDADIIARVDSLTAVDAGSLAGVMIRGDLSAQSAHAFAMLSSSGVSFRYRANAAESSSTSSSTTATTPQWLRLVRSGTEVSGYFSADGRSWRSIGTATIGLSARVYIGLAVSAHSSTAVASAVFSNVDAMPLSLPTGQSAVDIGSPRIPGTSSDRQGVYTITAGGTDIGGSSDEFRFVYQAVTGDVDIVARVDSIERVRSASRAGVMVRESLAANARNAGAFLSAGRGYSFQWRLDTGGGTSSQSAGGGTAPGWLRLTRSGHTFEAFRSADGATWTSMGIETVAMADTVYVGIAVTSRYAARATTALVDQLAIATPNALNQPPTVTVTAPASGASYTAPANLMVTATASDPENRLARVEFYANSARIGSVTASPYTVNWSAVPAGTYSLTAMAFDVDGESATSSAVTIDVAAANQAPTVTLTSPANGSAFSALAVVPLAATASDPEGRLAKVEFYVGSSLVATDTSAPFSASWTAALGTFAIKAVAYDADGGVAQSAVSTITVTASPRLVVFQASADHATLVTSYRLDVFSSGADPLTARPIASSDLGKPAPDPATNDITVDRLSFFTALLPGTYVATVSAVGSGGDGRSAPITFVR